MAFKGLELRPWGGRALKNMSAMFTASAISTHEQATRHDRAVAERQIDKTLLPLSTPKPTCDVESEDSRVLE